MGVQRGLGGQDTLKGLARWTERRGNREGTSTAWAAACTRGQPGPEPLEGTSVQWQCSGEPAEDGRRHRAGKEQMFPLYLERGKGKNRELQC